MTHPPFPTYPSSSPTLLSFSGTNQTNSYVTQITPLPLTPTRTLIVVTQTSQHAGKSGVNLYIANRNDQSTTPSKDQLTLTLLDSIDGIEVSCLNVQGFDSGYYSYSSGLPFTDDVRKDFPDLQNPSIASSNFNSSGSFKMFTIMLTTLYSHVSQVDIVLNQSSSTSPPIIKLSKPIPIINPSLFPLQASVFPQTLPPFNSNSNYKPNTHNKQLKKDQPPPPPQKMTTNYEGNSCIMFQGTLLCLSSHSKDTSVGFGGVVSFFSLNPSPVQSSPSHANVNATFVGMYNQSHTDLITKLLPHTHNKSTLFVASLDNLITIYDTSKPSEEDALISIINSSTPAKDFGFFGKEGEGLWVLTGVNGEILRLHDYKSGQPLWKYLNNQNKIHGTVGGFSGSVEDMRLNDYFGAGCNLDYFLACDWVDSNSNINGEDGEEEGKLVLIGGSYDGQICSFEVCINTENGGWSKGFIIPFTSSAAAAAAAAAVVGAEGSGHVDEVRTFVRYGRSGCCGVSGGEDGRVCLWSCEASGIGNDAGSLEGGGGKKEKSKKEKKVKGGREKRSGKDSTKPY